MKVSGLVLSLLLIANSAYAFKNTAPLFVQDLSADIEPKFAYVTKQENVPVCSLLGESGKKNIVLQVPNLSKDDFEYNSKHLSEFASLVKLDFFKYTLYYKYSGSEDIASECTDVNVREVELEDGLLSDLSDISETLVVKFPLLSPKASNRGEQLEELDQFIGLLMTMKNEIKLVVQGLPQKSSDTILNKVFEGIDQIMKGNIYKRAETEEQETTGFEEAEQEVADAFKEIQDLLSEEGDNGVTIYSSDSDVGSSASNSTSSGLLHHYQFFSPGIWMATIVSFALLSILIILFQWLNSLNISYKSFEKPIDNQKKTQ